MRGARPPEEAVLLKIRARRGFLIAARLFHVRDRACLRDSRLHRGTGRAISAAPGGAPRTLAAHQAGRRGRWRRIRRGAADAGGASGGAAMRGQCTNQERSIGRLGGRPPLARELRMPRGLLPQNPSPIAVTAALGGHVQPPNPPSGALRLLQIPARRRQACASQCLSRPANDVLKIVGPQERHRIPGMPTMRLLPRPPPPSPPRRPPRERRGGAQPFRRGNVLARPARVRKPLASAVLAAATAPH